MENTTPAQSRARCLQAYGHISIDNTFFIIDIGFFHLEKAQT
jgi:hypothetical protein